MNRKQKKLNLSDFQVKSFVTSLENKNSATIKGGSLGIDDQLGGQLGSITPITATIEANIGDLDSGYRNCGG